jgi:hypothetical protein
VSRRNSRCFLTLIPLVSALSPHASAGSAQTPGALAWSAPTTFTRKITLSGKDRYRWRADSELLSVFRFPSANARSIFVELF